MNPQVKNQIQTQRLLGIELIKILIGLNYFECFNKGKSDNLQKNKSTSNNPSYSILIFILILIHSLIAIFAAEF